MAIVGTRRLPRPASLTHLTLPAEGSILGQVVARRDYLRVIGSPMPMEAL